MSDFIVTNKLPIKSKNNTNKMIMRYTYSLIGITILTLLLDLIFNKHLLFIPLIKSISISLIIATIIDYILNLIFNKEKNILKVYTTNHTEQIALIIGLFTPNIKIYIIILAIFISLIVKYIYKGINISASLYGILIVIIYRYLTNDLITPLTNLQSMSYTGSFSEIVTDKYNIINYLIGSYYLSPILSIIAFIYLFSKKSIKYTIVFSYILTFSIIMLAYGIINGMIWFVFFKLITGSLIFLAVYTLPDYRITPITIESSLIYGIVLAILSAILSFIVPELAIIIPIIIGPLLLTKFLDNISAKLKYDKKTYTISLTICILLVIITIIALSIIY